MKWWMVDGHEYEQAPGVGDGQGSLVCYSPWGQKELDRTEQLNWTRLHMSGFPVLHHLPEFAQVHVHWVMMPSNQLNLCCPHLLPSILPSIRVFSNQSVLCIRWPKYWNFSFSISPSNEYLELISLRMDWLDLLAAQGTLKSLFPRHSSKASIHCIQLSL